LSFEFHLYYHRNDIITHSIVSDGRFYKERKNTEQITTFTGVKKLFLSIFIIMLIFSLQVKMRMIKLQLVTEERYAKIYISLDMYKVKMRQY
jgi:hypothetical protein